MFLFVLSSKQMMMMTLQQFYLHVASAVTWLKLTCFSDCKLYSLPKNEQIRRRRLMKDNWDFAVITHRSAGWCSRSSCLVAWPCRRADSCPNADSTIVSVQHHSDDVVCKNNEDDTRQLNRRPLTPASATVQRRCSNISGNKTDVNSIQRTHMI